MLHSTIHYVVGLTVAAVWLGPPLRRAWQRPGPLAGPLLRFLLVSHALGIAAIAPNLLRRAGCSEAWTEHPLMNVFLLAPLLNRLARGGAIAGPALLAAALAAQYLLLLAAVRRADRHGPTTGSNSPA